MKFRKYNYILIVQEGITLTKKKKKKKRVHVEQMEKHCWRNFSLLDSSIERSRNTFEIETRIGYCCRNRLSAE